MKRFFSSLVLALITVGLLTAATPTTTFTLRQELPETMNVGEEYTVVIEVNSDQEFISATALPSFQYPGKGVVAIQGGDRAGRGTYALLEITFKGKSSTDRMIDGVAPVYVVVGVRYGGGYVVTKEYIFNVTVP